MAYSSGMLRKRVHILNRAAGTDGDFGRNSAGRGYTYAITLWAGVNFNKGMKSLREGAVEAYDTIMVRMAYNDIVNRESMIIFDGRTFQVQSFNSDYQTNEIQLTVTETPGKDLSSLIPEGTQ